MNVGELQTLLNLFPEDLEVVLLGLPKEFRKPSLQRISVISCTTEKSAKFYFENNWEVLDGEKIEEVLLIN
jgi:hypothetical protein